MITGNFSVSLDDESMTSESYQPHVMLEHVKQVMGIRSDAQMSKRLGIGKSAISKSTALRADG